MPDNRVLTIILNYKTPQMTLRAAKAAVGAMRHVDGEIVIIDNNSGDGSFEEIQTAAEKAGWCKDNHLRVLQSPVNGGFGAGMNVGLRAGFSDGSTPDYYYLQNSDAFPEINTISTLRDFMATQTDAGLAGSYVHGTDDVPHTTAFRFPSIAGEFEGAARTGLITRVLRHSVVAMDLPQTACRVDWTAGASLMLRRDMIEAIDGFDETFFLYFEETELCHRAAQSGWNTYYVPESKIAHVGSVSTGMKKWQRTPQYWFEARHYYFVKTHGRAYAILADLARFAGGALYGLRRLIEGKPQVEPDHFTRDLLTHMLRGVSRRIPRPQTRFIPIAKEQK
ncbi:glycosyltransferase family 2 protein [Epibacterium ulvae]|uniref:glycosyltransferase family 2 protein n=1 Tax=Epibacterium ulvae TaxID=1156985 RepID=UPI002493C119|nr:glycosyltransferase family 2 protein [Epibacterium ulvae]